MIENWRPVVGYEGYYEVSDHGRVRSLDRILERTGQSPCIYRGKILAARSTDWAMAVGLHKAGRWRGVSVHRLVLEAFVGACPDGFEGCHNDGDYRNNHLSNLRWDSHSNNMFDMVRHGTHAGSSKTHCKNGHPFDSNNTYLTPAGCRACRVCQRENYRRYYQRKRVAS